MTRDRDVVWRIGEHHVGPLVAQQLTHGICLSRIRTEDPMTPQHPEVAEPADWNGRWRGNVIIGVRRLLALDIRQDGVDLSDLKPGQVDRQAQIRQQDGEFPELKRQ